MHLDAVRWGTSDLGLTSFGSPGVATRQMLAIRGKLRWNLERSDGGGKSFCGFFKGRAFWTA
jgi:hypothetical protein